MLSNVIITLTLLVITLFTLKYRFNLPKNVWILFIIQPLVMSASPVIVFIGGLLSTKLIDDASLATLPITIMILGIACAAIPAAMLAKKWGRKSATFLGFSIGFIASLLASYATQTASFLWFTLASLLFGISTAFIQQLRFAAIESTNEPSEIPTILSILMLSGIFSAFLGPEIALVGKDWIDSPYGYTGSFLFIGLLNLCAILLFSLFSEPNTQEASIDSPTRRLGEIISQPIFLISILSTAIGYALMSYLMTATPLSMHHLHGHSLNDTKWVIQTHIAAMFLPSLFTGWLVKRIGLKHLLLTGTIIYGFVTLVAFSGEQVIHYWWALLLLGIGWNFLFLTGTSLLPESYQASERHKVQALNDFIVFGCQASASLLAGWVLFKTSWTVVVASSLPFILLLCVVSFRYFRVTESKAY